MSGLVKSTDAKVPCVRTSTSECSETSCSLSNTALSWSGAGVWLPARQFPLPSRVEGMCLPRVLWFSGPGLAGPEPRLEPHRTSTGSPLPKGTEQIIRNQVTCTPCGSCCVKHDYSDVGTLDACSLCRRYCGVGSAHPLLMFY